MTIVDDNPLTVDSPADACRGAAWFAVLPDCDAARAAAARLAGPQVERHASGRPWIVGRWPAGELVVGGAGHNRIGVFGAGSASSPDLAAAAADAGGPGNLNRLAARLPGSFHLVASVGGAVRAQGSLSGVRRVFHARVGEVDVAADRCDVLAAAVGAGVAPERLASCLLVPEAPYPFEGEVMWRDVDALPEDCYLELGRDGRHRAVPWWTPPAPVLSLAEGARALREALGEAVAARVRTGRRLSSDLSGGLDSTPICYLAFAGLRERGAPLVSVTTTNGDPDDDDPAWADIAARAMPGLTRLIVPAGELPLPYGDLSRPGLSDDEPLLDPGGRGAVEHLVDLLTARGAQLHLTGDGGDELLEPEPTYLAELVRTRPGRALAHLRGYRAMYRWSWPTALRLLVPTPRTGRRAYAAWLAASADRITFPPAAERDEDTPDGAGFVYRLPPWATDVAADLLRGRIRRAAEDVRMLAPTFSQHQDVETVRIAGHDLRRINLLTTRFGLPRTAPYLDDRVVETCLSVRPDERATPWRYKPLITGAMRGLLPDEWLCRGTKADGTELHHAGLRAHRAQLLELCADSELARLGLVDAAALRANVTGMWSSGLWPVALTRTLGLERWLRDVTADRPTALAATV